MSNKFQLARSVACAKRATLANSVANRYEINEDRFRALVDGKYTHSIGMHTFKKALQDCIIISLFHVY